MQTLTRKASFYTKVQHQVCTHRFQTTPQKPLAQEKRHQQTQWKHAQLRKTRNGIVSFIFAQMLVQFLFSHPLDRNSWKFSFLPFPKIVRGTARISRENSVRDRSHQSKLFFAGPASPVEEIFRGTAFNSPDIPLGCFD